MLWRSFSRQVLYMELWRTVERSMTEGSFSKGAIMVGIRALPPGEMMRLPVEMSNKNEIRRTGSLTYEF